MTTIVAISIGDIAVIGCDSQVGSSRKWMLTNEEMKICTWEDGLAIGTTGYLRDMQILRDKFEPPPFQENQSVRSYVVAVSDALKVLFEQEKRSNKTDDRYLDSCFLVLCRREIYEIDRDFSVMRVPFFSAIGCGAEVALGYLEAKTENPKDWNHESIYGFAQGALKASAKYVVGVSEPFHVLDFSSYSNRVK